jgi:hypothetical protein
MSTCYYRKYTDMGLKHWALVATDYRQEIALHNEHMLPQNYTETSLHNEPLFPQHLYRKEFKTMSTCYHRK